MVRSQEALEFQNNCVFILRQNNLDSDVHHDKYIISILGITVVTTVALKYLSLDSVCV